jgi:hypothetical protein
LIRAGLSGERHVPTLLAPRWDCFVHERSRIARSHAVSNSEVDEFVSLSILGNGGQRSLGPLPLPPAAIVRRVTLSTKLHPDRFSAMSGKMAAIVAYILGESWTEPDIAALSVTSDGFVLTDAEFFGEAADLDRNLLNLLVAAEVTPEERADFERLYRERVDDWRPVLSGPQPASDRLMRPDFGAPPVLA